VSASPRSAPRQGGRLRSSGALTERLDSVTWELQELLELQASGPSPRHAAKWGHARAWEIRCNTISRREGDISTIRQRIEAIEIQQHTLVIATNEIEGGA
jgi:hypothetical protein